MRQKKMPKEEYAKLFCRDQKMRSRRVVYVSDEVHKQMKNIARYFYETYTTTSSLVDTILRHHLETHKELLDQLANEERDELFGRAKESSNDM